MNSTNAHILESDVQEVRGHKVYNTPVANIMYVPQALCNDPSLTPSKNVSKSC